MKNKLLIIILSIVGIVVIIGGIFGATMITSYNNAIAYREVVSNTEVAITVAQQNRYEKMTALIDALTNLQEHVETQLDKITAARTAYIAAAATNDIPEMSAQESILENEFISLQAIIEDNPDTFIATSAYLDYMEEISATTNLVTYARNQFNNAINSYNTYIQSFPRNMYLNWFGDFQVTAYYTAPENTAGIPSIG